MIYKFEPDEMLVAIFTVTPTAKVASLAFTLAVGSRKMAFTADDYLPSYEQLTVPEIQLSSAVLRAGAIPFGKYCDHVCKVRPKSNGQNTCFDSTINSTLILD